MKLIQKFWGFVPAQQVIKLWEEFETMGFPLEDIAQSLYQVELIDFIKSWQGPPVTLLTEVIVYPG